MRNKHSRLYYEWKKAFKNDWNLFPKGIPIQRMYELFDFNPEWHSNHKAFLDSYGLDKPPTQRELVILANIFGTDKTTIATWLTQR